jgi:Fe-S-cluster-containing dehydrogenase component
MVIDLKRCIGCYSCMIACKQENFLPPDIFWTRVLTTERGEYPQTVTHTVPVQCNHCREPVCVKVCPAGATIQRADGIVDIDYDKCAGCGYCVIACPYQQRTLYTDGEK